MEEAEDTEPWEFDWLEHSGWRPMRLCASCTGMGVHARRRRAGTPPPSIVASTVVMIVHVLCKKGVGLRLPLALLRLLEVFLRISGAPLPVVKYAERKRVHCRCFIRFFLVLVALGPGHYCCERRIWQLLVQCMGLLGKMRDSHRTEKCAQLLLQLFCPLLFAS